MDFREGLRPAGLCGNIFLIVIFPPMTSGTYWKQLCWLLPGAINSRGNS